MKTPVNSMKASTSKKSDIRFWFSITKLYIPENLDHLFIEGVAFELESYSSIHPLGRPSLESTEFDKITSQTQRNPPPTNAKNLAPRSHSTRMARVDDKLQKMKVMRVHHFRSLVTVEEYLNRHHMVCFGYHHGFWV